MNQSPYDSFDLVNGELVPMSGVKASGTPVVVSAAKPSRLLTGEETPQPVNTSVADDPVSAITAVAQEHGVNPNFLLGLAQLETRGGKATVKGQGVDSRNLFNIKDFSKAGTGIRALDKAEGSNHPYRRYDSASDSARDLVRLLGSKRYDGALTAQTPEEFAAALKRGRYATDPDHDKKVIATIRSIEAKAGGTAVKSTSTGQAHDWMFNTPDDQLLQSIGMGSTPQIVRPKAQMQAPENPGFFRGVGDVGLSFLQGVAGSVKSVTDLAGAGNAVSRGLDDVSKGLGKLKSEEAQQSLAYHQQKIKDAETNGDWKQEIGAYADMVWDMPADSLAQALGSLVTLGVGKAAQVVKLASSARRAGMTKEAFLKTAQGVEAAKKASNLGAGVNLGLGVGQGVGGVKGEQYERTYNAAKEEGLADDEAQALATEAQSYSKGWMQQAAGAALGYAAAKTGPLEKLASGQTVGAGGVLRRFAGGGAIEGATEGLQGGQSRYAGNTAAIDAGVLDESQRFAGVAGTAFSEGSLGFALGGGAGALGRPDVDPLATTKEAAKKPNSPISRAAVAGQPAKPEQQPAQTPVAAGAGAQSQEADPTFAGMSDSVLLQLQRSLQERQAAGDEDITDDEIELAQAAKAEYERRMASAPPAAPDPKPAPVAQQPANPAAPAQPAGVSVSGGAQPAPVKPPPAITVDLNPAPRAPSPFDAVPMEQDPAITQQQREDAAKAQERRSKRMAALRLGAYNKNPMMEFLGRHGLQPETQNEFAPGTAERRKAAVYGYGPVFRQNGKPLDLLLSNAQDEGFLPPEASESDLYDLVARAINGERVEPLYKAGSADALMQRLAAEREAKEAASYEDFLAQQQALAEDPDYDPFATFADTENDYDVSDLADSGYSDAERSLQAEVSALAQAYSQLGFDADDVLEPLAIQYESNPDEYYAQARQRLTQLIAQAAQPRGDGNLPQDSGEQAQASIGREAANATSADNDALIDYAIEDDGEPDYFLQAQTARQLREREDAIAEQARLNAERQQALEAKAQADDERKRIAQASVQAADTFELGRNALDNLTGQTDLLAQMPTAQAESPAPAATQPTAQPQENQPTTFKKPSEVPPQPGVYQMRDGTFARFDRGIWWRSQPTAKEALLTEFSGEDQMSPENRYSPELAWAPYAAITGRDAFGEASAMRKIPAKPADEISLDQLRVAGTEWEKMGDAQRKEIAQASGLSDTVKPRASQQVWSNFTPEMQQHLYRSMSKLQSQSPVAAAAQPQDGDILSDNGKPFAFEYGAKLRAKKEGGEVVQVEGGYVVRPTQGEAKQADPVAGDKIDDEWTAFSEQSGTLGIPRAEMPQVKAQDRGAMVNFLKARGIYSSNEVMPARAIKPTQAEFSPAKVQEAAARTDGNRSIIVSQDGYVVDGHHQWMAQRQKGESVKVIKLDQPIGQVLEALKEMPSAQPEQAQDATLANGGYVPAPPEFASFEAKTSLLGDNPDLVDSNGDLGLNERGEKIARTPWDKLSQQDRAMIIGLSDSRRASSDAYNAKVRKEYWDIERRRLQGERTIQQANGNPFKTEASAKAKLDEFDLGDTHIIRRANDGGFVLRDKRDVRESYTQAQAAVLAEMGIGESADGEIDATESQWEEIDRRTTQRLKQMLPAPESTPNQPATQEQREAIVANGLPTDTAFKPGKGKAGTGKWIASAGDVSGNLSDSIADAAKSLAQSIESERKRADKDAERKALAESVATKLKNGEQPTDVELRDLFGLQPGQSYVDQAAVGSFLVEHMGVPRNKIRESLGVAAGSYTTDTGTKYHTALPRKLHLAFGAAAVPEVGASAQVPPKWKKLMDTKAEEGNADFLDSVVQNNATKNPHVSAYAQGLLDKVKAKDTPKFAAGDQVRINGEDQKLHTIDQIGKDGWVYLKSGGAFPPEKAAEYLFKSEPRPSNATFGGSLSSLEDRTPSYAENMSRWRNEAGTYSTSQPDTYNRANSGGQVGVNGYFYKGGQFLPSTMAEPGKWKLGGKWVTSGREETAPYQFDYAPTPFSRSIYSMMRGWLIMQNGKLALRDGILENDGSTPVTLNTEVRPGVRGVLGKESLTAAELIDAWNSGQRWFDVKPDTETITTQTEPQAQQPTQPAISKKPAVQPQSDEELGEEQEAQQPSAEDVLAREHFLVSGKLDQAMKGNDAQEMVKLLDRRDELAQQMVRAGFTQSEIGANSLGLPVDRFNSLVKEGIYSREVGGAFDGLFKGEGNGKRSARKSKPAPDDTQPTIDTSPTAKWRDNWGEAKRTAESLGLPTKDGKRNLKLPEMVPAIEAKLAQQAAAQPEARQDDTMDDPEMAAYENGLTAKTRAQDAAKLAPAQPSTTPDQNAKNYAWIEKETGYAPMRPDGKPYILKTGVGKNEPIATSFGAKPSINDTARYFATEEDAANWGRENGYAVGGNPYAKNTTQPSTPLARAEAELSDWKARRDLPANAGNVADVDKEINRLEQTVAALKRIEPAPTQYINTRTGQPHELTDGQLNAIANFRKSEGNGSGKVDSIFEMDGNTYLVAERNGEKKVVLLPRSGGFNPAGNALLGFGFDSRRNPVVTQQQYEASQPAAQEATAPTQQTQAYTPTVSQQAQENAKVKAGVKLKQGNIAIATPIAATKTDFGDYKINHPLMPIDGAVPAKSVTIKDGMVVGMVPSLAEKLRLKTVGDVQDETELTKQKKAEKAEQERIEKEKTEREAKLVGGALGITAQMASGKLSQEEGNRRISALRDEYNAAVAAAAAPKADSLDLDAMFDEVLAEEVAKDAVGNVQSTSRPDPLDYTPKQYADAWFKWVAQDTGTPLAEVRHYYGSEAGLKDVEQQWVDAVLKAANDGQVLPVKTIDKLLEVRPNTRIPEGATPSGYQRPEARKAEKEEAAARKPIQRTAGQAAKSAATNTAAALANAIDGLGALFGGNGKEMASYRNYIRGPLSAQLARNGLEDLKERLNPEAHIWHAKYLSDEMDKAKAEVGELERLAAEAFPQAEELQAKRARLNEVVSVLSAQSEASRREAQDDDMPVENGFERQVRYSRNARTATGLPTAQVEAVVRQLQSGWSNAPTVVVVQDLQDPRVPQVVRDENARQVTAGAEGAPDGFIHGETVYLVASQIGSPDDAARVLLHETLGHYGLRGVFGDTLSPILRDLANKRRRDVVEMAVRYGLVPDGTATDASVADIYQAMTPAQREQAAEEVLAYMAQNQPELGFVQRAIAAIRQWLKSTFPMLGERLALLDSDIVANYITPARAFVEGGRPRVQAHRTAKAQSNLMDVLAALDESGVVDINC